MERGRGRRHGERKEVALARLSNDDRFRYAQAHRLLERIVAIATDPGDLVLDYYLGSGTTAVAAQRLGRPWVGIERNAEVVERFVIPRLQSEYAANPTGGFGVSRLS